MNRCGLHATALTPITAFMTHLAAWELPAPRWPTSRALLFFQYLVKEQLMSHCSPWMGRITRKSTKTKAWSCQVRSKETRLWSASVELCCTKSYLWLSRWFVWNFAPLWEVWRLHCLYRSPKRRRRGGRLCPRVLDEHPLGQHVHSDPPVNKWMQQLFFFCL